MKRQRVILLFALITVLVIGLLIRGYWRAQASQALLRAVKNNDTQGALDALRAHADPNIRDQGDTPLSLRNYLLALWKQLCGGKPATNDAWTVLALAVDQNNTVVVKALLAAGAKNFRETLEQSLVTGVWRRQSLTLLMVAARNKNVDIVQALIARGWDVHAVNEDGETALFYANDAATIKALVAGGADIQAKDKTGWSALDCALRENSPEVANALLDLGARDTKAMAATIRYGDDTKALKRMLNQGWEIETRDENGKTPLLVAVEWGAQLHLPAAVLLIQNGANVNSQDKDGNTPLTLATSGGRYFPMDALSPTVLKLLLQRGARIDAQDKEGYTALMKAASYMRPTLVKLLLQHGAQVNLRTRKKTALALARYEDVWRYYHDDSQAKVIRILQAAGARK